MRFIIFPRTPIYAIFSHIDARRATPLPYARQPLEVSAILSTGMMLHDFKSRCSRRDTMLQKMTAVVVCWDAP